jgi:gentisate 1,2-dioxygenase
MSEARQTDDADARRGLKQALARVNCRVHQADDPPLFTREPDPSVQTVLWRWRDLEPLLRRLGEEVALATAGPRRTLRLHNPGLPFGTTNTFWGSIQVILPGEVAGAHRHTASALRYIIRGRGASTTVDGRRREMNEGDLVLTPAWTWHDHVHEGDEPMIWLDVLDISLMKALQATFFEAFHTPQQPVTDHPECIEAFASERLMSPTSAPFLGARTPNPVLVYEDAMAEAALRQAADLAPVAFGDTVMEYVNPLDGGSALQTLGTRLLMLRPGAHTRATRHTGSKLCHVRRGEGATIVAGRILEWSKGDFFTVAPWAWHEHLNRSAEQDAVLFQVDDIPTLGTLGYYREETMTDNGGQQVLRARADEAAGR